jgi:hypothetical protein
LFRFPINMLRPWRMASSGMLHRVALVRTDVSEELSASCIKATRISGLGTTLAVTNNRRTCVGCYIYIYIYIYIK